MSDPPASPEQHRYVPYAQLVKMLVPSAGTVSVYGAADDLLWCSDGYERPDLRELLDAARRASGGTLAGTIESAPTGPAAYLTDLEDEHGVRLGTLVVELAESAGGRRSVAPSLLRPVVDCLESRLRLERGSRSESSERGVDTFTRLLEEDENLGPETIQRLLDGCVESLPADAGALVVPEAHVEAAAGASGGGDYAPAAVVEHARAQLLPWLELNDKSLVANAACDGPEAAARKILACPVRDARRRVKGVLALYRQPDALDFAVDDASAIEYLARKISMLLSRQHDALTGLLTRTAFEREAQRLLDASIEKEALLYIDVDHLHQVNDAFGFDCGDRVLSFAAERIRTQLGAAQAAGRLGGDRFAVMLPGTGVDEARGVAERIQAALGETDYVHLGHAIPVSITVGVAAARNRSVRHLIAAAELASKRAKQRGSARIVVSRDPGDAGLARDGEQLAYSSFEEALEHNALGLEAQPVMGLARDAGKLLGFEVFVRMRTSDGEWLSAQRFLRAAEYYGMMPAIDRWVIGSTLDMLRGLGGELPDLPLGISVNVSSQSLKSGGYPRFVLDLLSRAGLPPGLAAFELKESVAWNHLADVERFARTLGAAGSRVTLDNFGSGVGAITQLKSLPIKQIKLDGGLVRRCADDAETASLIQGLTRAAAGLKIATIAEQVETESLAGVLGTLQIDYAQGHHFGRPAPLADWLERLCAPRSEGNAALS